jgi:hypothetical protein
MTQLLIGLAGGAIGAVLAGLGSSLLPARPDDSRARRSKESSVTRAGPLACDR